MPSTLIRGYFNERVASPLKSQITKHNLAAVLVNSVEVSINTKIDITAHTMLVIISNIYYLT